MKHRTISVAAAGLAVALAATAHADPKSSSAGSPFPMTSYTSCDPGVADTTTCGGTTVTTSGGEEVKTSAAVQTGNAGTTPDTGAATASGTATASVYLATPAPVVTVTLHYVTVTAPTAAGTPDNRAGNYMYLSATAKCAGCRNTSSALLATGPTATKGTTGSVTVQLTNPNGGNIPKGFVQVSASSQSFAYIGPGGGVEAIGSASATADNDLTSISLSG